MWLVFAFVSIWPSSWFFLPFFNFLSVKSILASISSPVTLFFVLVPVWMNFFICWTLDHWYLFFSFVKFSFATFQKILTPQLKANLFGSGYLNCLLALVCPPIYFHFPLLSHEWSNELFNCHLHWILPLLRKLTDQIYFPLLYWSLQRMLFFHLFFLSVVIFNFLHNFLHIFEYLF